MLKNAIQWIKKNTYRDQGIVYSPQRTFIDLETTGLLISALFQYGEIELAKRYAHYLCLAQNEHGVINGFLSPESCTAKAIEGWLILVEHEPTLKKKICFACNWLIEKIKYINKVAINKTLCYEKGLVVSELYYLSIIKEAGRILNNHSYIDFFDDNIKRLIVSCESLKRYNNDRLGLSNIRLIENLLSVGLKKEAHKALQEVLSLQQVNGAIPASKDQNYICVYKLSKIAKICFKLGERRSGIKALSFIANLQNSTGGFYLQYGVNAELSADEEISYGVAEYISAALSSNIENKLIKNNIKIKISREKKDKITLVTYLADNNFGDTLIYNTIKSKLEELNYNTEDVEVYKTSELLEKANNSGFLFFVGGGLIERSAPEIIKRFIDLKHLLKVPYGMVGLSSGSFNYNSMYPSLKEFAENATFLYTRDSETVDTFVKAGAKKPPLSGVDIVFANKNLVNISRLGNSIAANFRDVPYPDITGDIEWNMWSKSLKNIGVNFLIPDSSSAQLKLKLPICKMDEINTIRRCEFIIAMRYHVVLVATMMGILPIPIAYCPKVSRLSKQLGISEFCIPQDRYDLLEPAFIEMKKRSDEIRVTIKNNVKKLMRNAELIISDAINKLEMIRNA